KQTFYLFADLNVLDYNNIADNYFQEFRKAGLRIGTQDLRIASIVLANNGIVLTRNLRDFEKVPNLVVQDWSREK
ncbi:MAG: type II toxin-antitoxin system VapC family toxin, partial [Cyanobacteria bacterium J06559_1]